MDRTPTNDTQSWAVTVERNGEQVVTLASNLLAGRDLSPEDERVIRLAAEHLLAFIGAKEKVLENIPEFIEPRFWTGRGMHGWGVFYRQEDRTLGVGCVQSVSEAVARNVAQALNDVLYEEVTTGGTDATE